MWLAQQIKQREAELLCVHFASTENEDINHNITKNNTTIS
jgi:hypothetical protein